MLAASAPPDRPRRCLVTILVITSRRDLTADLVIRAVGDRAPLVRVDLADFPGNLTLAAEFGGRWAGHIDDGTRTVDLADVTAVYYRRPGRPHLAATMPDGERAWAEREAWHGLRGVLASLPARWVNHPDRQAAAEYKPRQLATAAAAGLTVPHTLITSSPDAVAQFAAGHPDGVVYKPLTGSPDGDGMHQWALYTRPVDPHSDLTGVRHTAHLIQQRLRKVYEVRLTVVGGRMFAARIDAGSDRAREDWRSDYQHLTYRPTGVPVTAIGPIRQMMQTLGLRFGALDFVVDDAGRWVFLEVNPGGQWGWIEHHTGLPVAAAIAADLIEGDTCAC